MPKEKRTYFRVTSRTYINPGSIIIIPSQIAIESFQEDVVEPTEEKSVRGGGEEVKSKAQVA